MERNNVRLASLFSATRTYSQHADSPIAVAVIYNQEGLTPFPSGINRVSQSFVG
ncbi:hypothetical protein ACFYU8_14225 [Brevibacillus sp. NPDC003359]|uniref:hypothetical protein n=1 Tax=unclassified Brevibacillus TaxID=2684853 RepID=UPI0036A64021